MPDDHSRHEPSDPSMSRTYWLVAIVEVIVVAGLWMVGRYFGS